MSFQPATPFAGPSLILAQSAKELERKLAAYGVYPRHKAFPHWDIMKGAAGMTWELTVDDMPVWVVGVSKNDNPTEVVATLVHEAVHVWQGWSEWIGEHEPSAEFEAYTIEAIVKVLLQQYRIPRNKVRGV